MCMGPDSPLRLVLGAGLGAVREVRMAPVFLQATPDRALRFLTASAVNRQAVGSNPTRGANYFFLSELNGVRTFGLLPNDLKTLFQVSERLGSRSMTENLTS